MQHINIGTLPNDGTGDTLRVAFYKVNENFQELVAIDSSFSGDIQTLNTIISDGSTLNHTHTISQIIGLQTVLSGKVSTNTFNTQILAINASIQAINSTLSEIIDILNTKIGDAPYSGVTYGRKDGEWVVISGTSSSGTTGNLQEVTQNGNTTTLSLQTYSGFDLLNLSGDSLFSVFLEENSPIVYLQNNVGESSILTPSKFNYQNNEKSIWYYPNFNKPSGDYILATLDDISNFVPYTGGTNNLILSGNTISANGIHIGDTVNYLDVNIQNGNYLSLLFRGEDIGPDLFGTSMITANPEEGINFYIGDAIGDINNTLFIGQSGVLINISDSIDTNPVQITSTSTNFSKPVNLYEMKFENGGIQTNEVGKLKWNDTDGTLDLGLKGGNTILQIGQESVIRIVNKTASNVDLLESNYQAVRVTGAQGNRLKVDLAQANNDLNSAQTIGIVTETILNNQEGFITTNGLVRNINTTGSLQGETWADGDMLYLSPTIPGNLTKVKPVAPEHIVIMGYVVRAHITQGQIFVKVDNGYELDELHNVNVSGATTGNTLMYNGSVWENVNPFDYFDAKPIIYQKHINIPVFGNPAINNVEGVPVIISGPVARNWADTDIVSRTQRMGLTVSTTGNLAQLRQTLVYFSRNGGFDLTTGFNMAENASDTAIRFFMGVSTNIIFTNVEPNTLLNCIGVCRLSTSNNLHIVHNDNTGIGTTIDLGTNFPANTISSDKYLLNIETTQDNQIYINLNRNNGQYVYEVTISSDIPTTSTGLNFGAYIVDTSGAAVTTGFDWYGSYIMIK